MYFSDSEGSRFFISCHLSLSRSQSLAGKSVCVCVEEEDNCSSCFVHNFKWAVESLSLATGSYKFTPAAKSHGTTALYMYT